MCTTKGGGFGWCVQVGKWRSGSLKMKQTFIEKFSQAWSACMLCMVQGDLTVLTINHALTASKTGLLTGLAYCITMLGDGQPKGRWYPAWLTGVLTMAADIVVHPSHFGDQWVEAACTGAGAALLCFIWERGIQEV